MVEKLKEIIARRVSLHPEDDFGRIKCWEEALLLVKEDSEAVLDFINNVATDEEVYWFSERLCEMYDLTQDERYIDAFVSRAEHITDEEMKRSILQEVNYV
ncbi:MAG: hypothetical protein MJ126_03745 [Lachnospiraceae bacterium]|nr:hypothetical protein [Lachnospiraceae bacterium]